MRKYKSDNTMIVLVVVFVILLLWKLFKSSPEVSEEKLNVEEKQKETPEQKQKTEPYVYEWKQKGDKGEAVKKIQKRAQLIGKIIQDNFGIKHGNASQWFQDIHDSFDNEDYKTLKIDGIFGIKTERVVKAITDKKDTSLDNIRNKYNEIAYIIKKYK